MLRDLFCALGFACSPVQPDVSGHTILNLLLQTNAQEDLMLPALGSLYENVSVTERTATLNRDVISVSLGRYGRQISELTCTTRRGAALAAQREQYQVEFTPWSDAGRGPPGPGYSARADCQFTYDDGQAEKSAFLEQADQWGRSQIGLQPEQLPEIISNHVFATESGAARVMVLKYFDLVMSADVQLMFDVP